MELIYCGIMESAREFFAIKKRNFFGILCFLKSSFCVLVSVQEV